MSRRSNARDPNADRPANAVSEALYAELHAIAARHMRGERHEPMLQPTAILNEAWVRLAENGRAAGLERAEMLALASVVVRNALVDHARRRDARKRGGDWGRAELDSGVLAGAAGASVDLLDLHDALDRLAECNERHAKVVELRFFGGLEVHEIASLLGVSPDTVRRDWRMARAWLHRELEGAGGAR